MSITDSWSRLDGWLSQHAPATYAVLAPPATDAELQAGVALPPEVVESLRCHNGLAEWANLLPEAQPSTAAQIAENWQLRIDLADEFAVHPPASEPYWHPAWIPWADSDGDLQVIDVRTGRVGMAAHDGTGDFADGWPDLASYLVAVVDSLHTGAGVNGWYPYLTTHQELWWDRGPDQRAVNDEPLVRVPSQT
ncbi:SMI1/KNR4 family protein [Kribbella kalugense]|uniref:Cell wall assembly regulator SMI1 n=1 Tax=Kribbella kalugense TaxID=2512221 RepID=A0A4R7ZHG2_9ACTN|nr:SMI1/KNR4 family protein [Kribbella kalugense]TDW17137.1 cell wall assembly regulator SMI1 [Kribbella kalugense]